MRLASDETSLKAQMRLVSCLLAKMRLEDALFLEYSLCVIHRKRPVTSVLGWDAAFDALFTWLNAAFNMNIVYWNSYAV